MGYEKKKQRGITGEEKKKEKIKGDQKRGETTGEGGGRTEKS